MLCIWKDKRLNTNIELLSYFFSFLFIGQCTVSIRKNLDAKFNQTPLTQYAKAEFLRISKRFFHIYTRLQKCNHTPFYFDSSWRTE